MNQRAGFTLGDQEFARFQAFIFEAAGITLGPNKKALVSGRLEKRLRHHQLASFGDYLRLLDQPGQDDEVQLAVDLLTTNETYFFREPKHFELLREAARQALAERRVLRVWSAACSSGEEPYSIAMVLDDELGERPWELLASDISTKVLAKARHGHYPEARASQLPPGYRQRYCLRGTGQHAGTLLVQKQLRQRVQFAQINLDRPLPALGAFDLVFLRNVMIYFNPDTKRRVVQRISQLLRPRGLLLIGHSESISDLGTGLQPLRASVYQRPG